MYDFVVYPRNGDLGVEAMGVSHPDRIPQCGSSSDD